MSANSERFSFCEVTALAGVVEEVMVNSMTYRNDNGCPVLRTLAQVRRPTAAGLTCIQAANSRFVKLASGMRFEIPDAGKSGLVIGMGVGGAMMLLRGDGIIGFPIRDSPRNLRHCIGSDR
jgi:hypothetical protein